MTERFYRLGSETDARTAGSGLGLAIVQWAISAHRGRLLIDASDRGGARIVLVLPAA